MVVAVFLLVALLLAGGMHWYLWRRLVHDTLRTRRARRFGTVAVIALGLLLVAGLLGRLLPMRQQKYLAWPAYLWLAVLFYLLVVLLAVDVVRLPVRFLRKVTYRRTDPERRRFLARVTAVAAGVVAAGALADGIPAALGPPRIRRARSETAYRRSSATRRRYTSERRYRRGQNRRTRGCCTPNAREHQNQSVSQRHR